MFYFAAPSLWNNSLSQFKNNQFNCSTIDHLASNKAVLNTIIDAGVLHDAFDPSYHAPIYAKILLTNVDLSLDRIVPEKKVKWALATEEAKIRYKEVLENILSKIVVPAGIKCRKFKCQSHILDIEDYIMSVIEAVESASINHS